MLTIYQKNATPEAIKFDLWSWNNFDQVFGVSTTVLKGQTFFPTFRLFVSSNVKYQSLRRGGGYIFLNQKSWQNDYAVIKKSRFWYYSPVTRTEFCSNNNYNTVLLAYRGLCIVHKIDNTINFNVDHILLSLLSLHITHLWRIRFPLLIIAI